MNPNVATFQRYNFYFNCKTKSILNRNNDYFPRYLNPSTFTFDYANEIFWN